MRKSWRPGQEGGLSIGVTIFGEHARNTYGIMNDTWWTSYRTTVTLLFDMVFDLLTPYFRMMSTHFNVQNVTYTPIYNIDMKCPNYALGLLNLLLYLYNEIVSGNDDDDTLVLDTLD